MSKYICLKSNYRNNVQCINVQCITFIDIDVNYIYITTLIGNKTYNFQGNSFEIKELEELTKIQDENY